MSRAGLLVLTSLAACGEFASEDSLRTVNELNCTLDAECPGGFVCRENVCVENLRPTSLSSVHLEIVPPSGSLYPRTHLIEPVSSDAHVVLPYGVSFSSVVVLDALSTEVSARVTVSGQGRIPGRELEPAILTLPGQPGSLSLAPGRYSATVVPLDSSLTGMFVRTWDVTGRGTALVKQFVLPERRRRLTGTVSSRSLQEAKRPGVRVRAYALESGLASTEGVSDASGHYEIKLPETDETHFSLEAFPPAEEVSWRFSDTVALSEGLEHTFDILLDDTSPESRGVARVRVLGLGDAGPEPVAGARITLTASIAPSFKVLRIEGTTDAYGVVHQAGGVELHVLAARYVVDVRAPLRSPFRSTTTVLDLGQVSPNASADRQVILSRRVAVGATIERAGQPVPNAQVELESTKGEILSESSDDVGRLETALDPGRWRVRVSGAGLPVHFHLLEVPETEEPIVRTWSVPSTIELAGFVTGQSADPVSRANINAFLEVGGSMVSLGQTSTDPSGYFSLSLADATP